MEDNEKNLSGNPSSPSLRSGASPQGEAENEVPPTRPLNSVEGDPAPVPSPQGEGVAAQAVTDEGSEGDPAPVPSPQGEGVAAQAVTDEGPEGASAEQERPSSPSLRSGASPQGEAEGEVPPTRPLNDVEGDPVPPNLAAPVQSAGLGMGAEGEENAPNLAAPVQSAGLKGGSAEPSGEAKGAEVEELTAEEVSAEEPPQSTAEAVDSSPFMPEGQKVGAKNEVAAAQPVSKGKKALNIIVDIVVGIILVFVVFMTVNIIRRGTNKYTDIFGKTYIGVETDSMDGDEEDSEGYVGSFGPGSMLVVRILSEDEKLAVENGGVLKVGDVVTYMHDIDGDGVKELNTHRIVEVLSYMDDIQYYQTKGDNNDALDDYYLIDVNIVGIVESHVDGIGYVLTWLDSSTGFLVCVVVPSFALVVYCIVNLILTIRAKDKADEADKEAELRKKILSEMGLNEDGSKKE